MQECGNVERKNSELRVLASTVQSGESTAERMVSLLHHSKE